MTGVIRKTGKSMNHRGIILLIVMLLLPIHRAQGTEKQEGRAIESATSLVADNDNPYLAIALENELPDSIPLDLSGRTYKTVPFADGERLTYSIDYGIINAGEATMEITGPFDFNGRLCYNATSVAKTNTFFSLFFKVRDTVTSYIDREGIFSWYFRKRLREGSFKADVEVRFDQYRRIAVYDNGKYYKVEPMVQDILSSLYYIRTQEMSPGRSIYIENHTDRKNYPLEVKILEEVMVETPLGKFTTYKVEPILRGPGIFKHKGRLFVFFTTDDRKLPVLLQSKVVLGHFKATLIKAERGVTAHE
jgi:hypothetical protein